MLTVSELANHNGATPHAVRYYTRLGLMRPERNLDNGYRLYEYREVSRLTFIRQTKRLGYTLEKAGDPSIYVLEFSSNGIVIAVLHKDYRYKIGPSALHYQYLTLVEAKLQTAGQGSGEQS